MNVNRSLHGHVIALVFLCFTPPPLALAQDPLTDLRRELTALRAEVQQLREQVEALKEGSAKEAAAPAAVELLNAQVAELSQTRVESTSRLPVKLFGTVHANFFSNSANPNWLDIPNLVMPSPVGGSTGSMSATLRQTRVGFTVDAPRMGALRTSGVVALDFFGGIPAFQTGQVFGLPRLVVAYARIDGDRTGVEVGQDQVILAPRDPTSIAAFAFPLLFRSGNLYLRAPQARVEHAFLPRLRAFAGIVAPVAGDFTGTDYVFVPPALSGERSRRPGMQARIVYETSRESDAPRSLGLGVSGHVGWERRGTVLAKSWAGAVDFATRRDVVGVAGELFVADNADAFGGALGLDARSAGGWTELQLFPSNRISLTAGVGVDAIRGAQRFSLPRRQNRAAYGNIIYSVTPDVRASLEYRQLETTTGSAAQTNHHFSFVLVHAF